VRAEYPLAISRLQIAIKQAKQLAATRAVIFIDASLDSAVSGVSVTAMAPGREQPNDGHVCNPQGLLALCRAVYGRVPKAWWVCVRAEDVGFGTGLSPGARERIEPALARLRRLLGSIKCMK
jgi:Ni,Fe-hydrogenase maturation factor